MTRDLATLPTPCLLIAEDRMRANIARIHARLAGSGIVWRPHLKTAKCVEVARLLASTPRGPAMVSTLREAEVFAAAGFTDLTYGVGIAPDKLPRVTALRARGVDLGVIFDNADQARALARAGDPANPIPALIEIDCDGHRSGVAPDNAELLRELAGMLAPGAVLRGVLTHAGESYSARGPEALRAAAEQERAAVVRAAAILRDAGHACPVVSAGSSPTFFAGGGLEGLTEMRAGVSVFFDLFQAGVGICATDDIALSVLTTVIGHQRAKGWIITDAGWMAMSRDRGTSAQPVDQGYGLVCDSAGAPLDDLIVIAANQEHGIIGPRPGTTRPAPDLPVGTRLRILPNHACATGAQYQSYHLLDAAGAITAEWPRFSGW